MSDPIITCPGCKTSIKLTDSLAAPLLTAKEAEFRRQLAAQAKQFEDRTAELKRREDALAKEKASIDEQIAARLVRERKQLVEEAHKNAKLALATDLEQKDRALAELQDALRANNEKLADAQKAHAEVLRKQRELEDQKRELDLTIEQRVTEQMNDVRSRARTEAEESMKLKLSEKDLLVGQLQAQIEDMKRKVEQGSQQRQGEVQELELESLLTSRFPRDTIASVPKGEFGGDVLQGVFNAHGSPCGSILWESKRTQRWNDAWLAKLRDDQRRAKADIAVIVTQTLPKDVEHFELIEGVYVVSPRCAMTLAAILRQGLIEVSNARLASEGQHTKMELMYSYLTGTRFRQRVQSIVESISSMEEDLSAERRAVMKMWAKREAQIERAIGAMAGMYGELQGIAGKSLQEIEGLALAIEGEETIKEGQRITLELQ